MGKRVAVIGAGPTGLITLKHLGDCPTVSDIVGFERYGEVGGMWVYTDRTGTDVDGLPVNSPAYKDLRTNTPKIGMHFPDFPLANVKHSVWHHEEFKDYLQAFSEHFKLNSKIKFNTLVSNVDPVTPGSRDTRWNVTYCSPGKPETSTTEKFDAVIVCNGHYCVPYEPELIGRATFTGTVFHVHDFRVADPLKDKTVVLVRVGLSTLDLIAILGTVAKKIIVSCGPDAWQCQLTDNACRKPLIHHLTETSAVFDNGEEERVDAIILCTGYRYSFPFLTEDCGIVLHDEDRRVTPLYKHMINTVHPTLMFVGVVDYGLSIVLFDRQARFLAKVLDGTVTLPDQAGMEEDTEREFQARMTGPGAKSCRFHKLALYGPEYCDSLSELAHTPTMPLYQRQLFEYLLKEAILKDTLAYKDHVYEVAGDSFVTVKKKL